MKRIISILSVVGILAMTGCQNSSSPSAQTTSRPNTNIGGDFRSSETDANKNLLILGDSISIGYSPAVSNLLTPMGYTVTNIEDSTGAIDNVRNSWWFAQNVQNYLNQAPNAGIILFNVGIWNTIYADVFLAANPGVFDPRDLGTSDADYQSDLISIAQQLKATGARVIFVLSTDCLPNSDEDVTRIPGLNAIAQQVLPGMGIEVYDLNTISTKLKNHHAGSNHFDDAGNAILAGYIANAIMGGLKQ